MCVVYLLDTVTWAVCHWVRWAVRPPGAPCAERDGPWDWKPSGTGLSLCAVFPASPGRGQNSRTPTLSVAPSR